MTPYNDVSAVAVIGFSFRLLGRNHEMLWKAMLERRHLVATVATYRWSQSAFFLPN